MSHCHFRAPSDLAIFMSVRVLELTSHWQSTSFAPFLFFYHHHHHHYHYHNHLQ
jgi:hypothetical protein